MKQIFIIGLFCFLACRNDEKKDTVSKKVFSEFAIPNAVFKKYCEKIGLPILENGDNTFEVRKWHIFFNDSFPAFLERYYYNGSKLKGEVFVFHNSNGKSIKKSFELDDLKKIEFEKYDVGDIPERYFDSLTKKYSLFRAENPDLSAIIKMNEKGYLSHLPSLVFMEQLFQDKYYAVFMRNPIYFKDINEDIKRCAAFFEFTRDSLFLKDSISKKWFDEKLERSMNQ